MKAQSIVLLLTMLMALAIAYEEQLPFFTDHNKHDNTTSSTSTHDQTDHENSGLAKAEATDTTTTSSLRGTSRFLASRRPAAAAMTCDKNPKVCRAKGSSGPDCCKKKCVDFSSDVVNCGKCGKKCKFSEICCKGKCVNPRSDKRNCGSCYNRCKKGSSCVYGMCSYAN